MNRRIAAALAFTVFMLTTTLAFAGGYGNGDTHTNGGKAYRTGATKGSRFFGRGSSRSAFGVRDYDMSGMRFHDMRNYQSMNRLMSYTGYDKSQRLLGHRHRLLGSGYNLNGVRPVHH